MAWHDEIAFEGLHKAKVQIGLLANLPATPEGAGDMYWATDAHSGSGALYITNLAGDEWKELTSSSMGSVESLNDLDDVSAASPNAGDGLVYNDITELWQAQQIVQMLGDLLNVDLTGIQNGDIIVYNSSESEWQRSTRVTNMNSITDVKTFTPALGDMLIYDGILFDKLPVGDDDEVLVGDSTEDLGVAYKGISEISTNHITIRNLDDDTTTDPATDYTHIYVKNNTLYIKLDDGSTTAIGTAGAIGVENLIDVDIVSLQNNQVLKFNNSTLTWYNGDISIDELIDIDGVTAKGSFIVHDGTEHAYFPVGNNNEVIVADSTAPFGFKWAENEASLVIDNDARIMAILGW
jgi:hypothetical protein